MRTSYRLLIVAATAFHVAWFSAPNVARAASDDRDAVDFFEKWVRPLIVEKCLKCHGGDKVRGGLRLIGREQILKGGESGPAVVPGSPEGSLLIRAVEYQGDLRMPPTGKLSGDEIARLRHWISQGAVWPDATQATASQPLGEFTISAEQRRWWSFQPIRRVPPPVVKDGQWPRTEIDRFILTELEDRGLAPAAPADRRTLLRRASFDLTGLPPTPEQVEAFVNDSSPAAFEKVIDRLLGSPAYGERWGRHWLDVARYADYYQENPRAHASAHKFELFEAYRYRDWVVDAFNRDLPYDQFILHQIAGDQLPGPAGDSFYAEGLVATAFLALGSWDHGDIDKDKVASDIVDDQIDTVGRAFLGLTLGCARCHDHKFDPISQADYYGLAGIFYSTHVLADLGRGDHSVLLRVPLAPAEYVRTRQHQTGQLQAMEKKIQVTAARQALAALAARSPIARSAILSAATSDLAQLQSERQTFQKKILPAPPLAIAAQEGGIPGGLFPGLQDVPVHIRGSYTRLGPKVPRRLPVLFAGEGQRAITHGSGRLALARWIAAPDNPLTPRVLVNRVWQHHFGEGIVRTPGNFGKLGEAPTHAALLDWLAARFIEDGWSVKALHRRIMLSAAYRQASVVSPDVLSKDPDNRWLGRMTARRLEAEALRDAMLSVSGRLDMMRGGAATADLSRPRRSLYVQTTRWNRNNFSTLFDAANPDQSVEMRTMSTVAPQALFLLNNPFVREQAGHLAVRLSAEVPDGDEARIDRMYRLVFGRPARPGEFGIAKGFLARAGRPGAEDAWADFAHLLFCSNEFAYVD
jgi:Protein of unknown function (DUF1553)/Protein of unknown function (DUF1549)/Planctomycete cytochrome C